MNTSDRVVHYLQQHPGAANKEIARDLDVSRPVVSQVILALEDRVAGHPDAEDARVIRYHLKETPILIRNGPLAPIDAGVQAEKHDDKILSTLGRIEQLLIRLLRHLGGQS